MKMNDFTNMVALQRIAREADRARLAELTPTSADPATRRKQEKKYRREARRLNLKDKLF